MRWAGVIFLIFLLFIGIYFVLWQSQESFYSSLGDLELSLDVGYSLEIENYQVRADSPGRFFKLVEDGEKVKKNQQIGLMQNGVNETYFASSSGIVAFLTDHEEVEEGEALFALLSPQGILNVVLFPEERKMLQDLSFWRMDIKGGDEFFARVISVEENDGNWLVKLEVKDFLPQLFRDQNEKIKIHLGTLRNVTLIPLETLKVKDGFLGVEIRRGGKKEFAPVEVLGNDGIRAAVEGIKPGEELVK